MRRVILWEMISLDGFFEGPAQGELDWFAFDSELEKYILDSQMEAGTLLFGRVTFEFMASYWPNETGQIADFMNSVEKIVFSRTLKSVDWNNSRIAENSVVEEVGRLKQQDGRVLFVFGAADFASTLIREGLVDEYRIGINPLMLGAGVPFFKDSTPRVDLTLVKVIPFESGLVVLHYVPK